MENKVKYLDMIMRIIERMEKNEFSLKGWTMTLVVAICALSANDSERKFILIALIPIIIFWLLDSLYLQIERKYRILYKNVSQSEGQIDYSFDFSKIVFSETDKRKLSFIRCFLSFSEILFYLPLNIALVMIVYLLDIF